MVAFDGVSCGQCWLSTYQRLRSCWHVNWRGCLEVRLKSFYVMGPILIFEKYLIDNIMNGSVINVVESRIFSFITRTTSHAILGFLGFLNSDKLWVGFLNSANVTRE